MRGEWIPGVPAFHEGGFVHNVTEHGGPSPFGDVILPSGSPIPQGSPIQQNVTQASGNPFLAEGLIPIPGQPGLFWDPKTGRMVDTRPGANALPSGPGGAAAPQFRPGELDFLKEQFGFEQESFKLDLELRRLQEQHQNAIAQGQLALARQTEARIAQIQRRQQQLDAALGKAQGIAGLASSRGNIEANRAQFLSQLAANPRDFAQLNIGLGGGQPFLSNLLNKKPIGGQSTSLIGDTPTLGAQFQKLLEAITARPDVPLFDEALQAFQNVPQFRKGGTHMVTDEPIIGIGAISGRPRLTLGEPTAEFPRGAPEKLEVTPLQAGGTVKTGGSQPFNPFPPGTTLEDITGAAKPPAPPTDFSGLPPGPFALPDFTGIGTLVGPLGLDISGQLNQAIDEFGFGQQNPGFGEAVTNFRKQLDANNPSQAVADLFQVLGAFGGGNQGFGEAATKIHQSIPKTGGEAIRNLMQGLPPQQFFNLLPSQMGNLESLVSALAVPPENFITSLLRQFPTGPDPSSVSFGNFRHGGTISTVGARPTLDMYRAA